MQYFAQFKVNYCELIYPSQMEEQIKSPAIEHASAVQKKFGKEVYERAPAESGLGFVLHHVVNQCMAFTSRLQILMSPYMQYLTGLFHFFEVIKGSFYGQTKSENGPK